MQWNACRQRSGSLPALESNTECEAKVAQLTQLKKQSLLQNLGIGPSNEIRSSFRASRGMVSEQDFFELPELHTSSWSGIEPSSVKPGIPAGLCKDLLFVDPS